MPSAVRLTRTTTAYHLTNTLNKPLTFTNHITHTQQRHQSSLFFKEAQPIRHQERRLIKMPIERLYDVVSDVAKYQEFVPWCLQSRVISKDSHQMKAELTVGFQLLTEKYISHVELRPPMSVTAVSSQVNLFEYLRSEWKFTPSSSDPKNATWVTFQIDFKFKLALYNELSDLFMQQVVKKMVQAFETRCKQLEKTSSNNKPTSPSVSTTSSSKPSSPNVTVNIA